MAGTGEVASAATVGPPPGMRVRLSSNESPFGPSPAATAAILDHAAQAHLYPDDQSTELRGAVADHEGVAIEQVGAGTGSAGSLMDIIAHEIATAGGPPGEVVTYQRAFIVYRLATQVSGGGLVEAPLGDGYARDPQALLDLITDETRVVCIDNPGNPTGVHLTGDDLRGLVEDVPERVTVIIDEAYHHFASGRQGYVTVQELGLDHPRLVVTRTFSKAYALAGLRVGYAIGPPDLIASVDAWRVRFHVNAMAQRAAVAALGDTEHLARTVEGTLEGRRRMAEGLSEIGVPFVDGLGNFLLIELGEPAAGVASRYAEHGVGVRTLAPYGLDEQIRVTVGTPDEVGSFLEASRDVLAEVASRR